MVMSRCLALFSLNLIFCCTAHSANFQYSQRQSLLHKLVQRFTNPWVDAITFLQGVVVGF